MVLAACLVVALAGCEGGEGASTGQAAAGKPALRPMAGGGMLAMFGTGDGAPRLEEADRRQAARAAARAYAAPDGKPVHWQNPRSGTFGEIVPLGRPQEQGDRVCRQFRQTVLVSGRSYQATGTSCSRVERAVRSDIGRSGSGAGRGNQG